MTALADTVQFLIRTRADLHWRSAATAHGHRMFEGIGILFAAAEAASAEVFAVTQKAIASSRR